MSVGELLREAGHIIGPDHKSILLARIYEEKSALPNPQMTEWPPDVREAVEMKLAEFKLRWHRAVVVSLKDILSAADKADELITVDEVGEWTAEPPRNHLYKSHKTPTDQQVATLLTANGPPAFLTFGQDAGRAIPQEVNTS